MTKQDNKYVADALRDLAREYEHDDFACMFFFTCPRVGERVGKPVRDAYADVFQLEPEMFTDDETVNQRELWDLPVQEMTDVRILMLCFAASMAETGDLL